MLYYLPSAQKYLTHDRSQGAAQPSFDRIGVETLDHYTLAVALNNRRPSCLGLLSHERSWAVPKQTLKKHRAIDASKGQWTRPGIFVSNGGCQKKS